MGKVSVAGVMLLLWTSTAWGQDSLCESAKARFSDASTVVTNTQTNVAAHFMAMNMALQMGPGEQQKIKSEYCQPDRLSEYESAATAVDAAIDAAKYAESACPEYADGVKIGILVKQYQSMKTSVVQMRDGARRVCR